VHLEIDAQAFVAVLVVNREVRGGCAEGGITGRPAMVVGGGLERWAAADDAGLQIAEGWGHGRKRGAGG